MESTRGRTDPTQLTRWSLSGGRQMVEGQAEGVPGWKTGQETEGLGGQFAKETAGHLLGTHNNHWGQGGLIIGQASASGGLNRGRSLVSGGPNSGQALAVTQSSPKVGTVASIEGSGITWGPHQSNRAGGAITPNQNMVDRAQWSQEVSTIVGGK